MLRIYVDALDEFNDNEPKDRKEPKDLAAYFQSLISPNKGHTGIGLNICISCRYPVVGKDDLQIKVEERNHRDISTYVQNELTGIKGEGDEAQELKNWIANAASGIFQWAFIVVEKAKELNDEIESPKRLLELLQDEPQGLDKLYQKSFETMDTARRPRSLRLLQWICFAKRPLSIVMGAARCDGI